MNWLLEGFRHLVGKYSDTSNPTIYEYGAGIGWCCRDEDYIGMGWSREHAYQNWLGLKRHAFKNWLLYGYESRRCLK